MTSRHVLKHFSARHTRRRFKLAFYILTKKKRIFYIIVLVKEVINYTKDNDDQLPSVVSRYELLTFFRICIRKF